MNAATTAIVLNGMAAALGDKEGKVRAIAAKVLGQVGPKGRNNAIRLFMGQLSCEVDPRVEYEVVQALKELGVRPLAPVA